MTATLVYLDAIPAELRDLNRWVAWRYEIRDGKRTKIPVNARTGGNADSTHPATWSNFRQAVSAYENGQLDGIGFVLGDGVVGVDLDHCRDPESNKIEPWAQAIIDKVNTYAEISVSGSGVHLILRGRKPGSKCKKRINDSGGAIEIYETARYLTVTGERIEATPDTVEVRQAELNAVYAELWPEPTARPAHGENGDVIADDDALIQTAQAAANGRKFIALWHGDTSGHNGDDSSADLALVNLLAFYCGPDAARIDRLYRRSKLCRDKWDRQDYRERTIAKALEGRTKFFRRNGHAKNRTSVGDFRFTDYGNAERLVAEYGDDLRFTNTHGWLRWDGRRWTRDIDGEVMRRAKATIRGMYVEAAKSDDEVKRQQLATHATKTEKAERIRAMIRLAESESAVAIDPARLNSDPWLFNCANGTIDLRTGILRPHRRDDLITKLAPVEFNSDAECPQFMAVVNRTMNYRTDLSTYLQRAFGYALTGLIRDHVLQVVYGTGANGKTTIIEAVMAAMGDYAATAAPKLLIERKNEQHPTEVADLFAMRFVVCMESGEGARLDEERVKQLTGGDKLKGRFMRQDFWSFDPSHKIFLSTNHRPIIKGTDWGIWRRVKLIPFEVTIPEEEQDKALPEKLRGELPGILRWCVDGCVDWQRQGLNPPEVVRVATGEYRDEMDVLGQWIEENCIVGQTARVQSALAYANYRSFVESGGERPVGTKRFHQSLVEKGFQTRPIDGRNVWVGIGVRGAAV